MFKDLSVLACELWKCQWFYKLPGDFISTAFHSLLCFDDLFSVKSPLILAVYLFSLLLPFSKINQNHNLHKIFSYIQPNTSQSLHSEKGNEIPEYVAEHYKILFLKSKPLPPPQISSFVIFSGDPPFLPYCSHSKFFLSFSQFL